MNPIGQLYMDYKGFKNVLWGPFMFMLDNRNIGTKILKGFIFPKNITSLVGIKFPNTLRLLILSNNNIKSLKGVVFPNSLINLDLSENSLISLKRVISLNDNKIKTLKNIILPNSIETLNLSNNDIKSFEGFIQPKNLKEINIAGNP